MTKGGSGARLWAELKTTDFANFPADSVALVPVGAIEQHGPHLPVSTDMTLAESMAAEIAGRVTDGTVLVMPGVSYGKSDEHLDFPGTVSLDETTLLSTDRKSTRLNSSHVKISYAVFCLKK